MVDIVDWYQKVVITYVTFSILVQPRTGIYMSLFLLDFTVEIFHNNLVSHIIIPIFVSFQ